jgi:hypothetical protein
MNGRVVSAKRPFARVGIDVPIEIVSARIGSVESREIM